ncbi:MULTISPECIES: hypothetical protein [Rhodophyticola]|uniref:hypothetical protein n=1 Tax=Rhodophyticola TaxID=2680018 RepID=UPI001B101488|nr:hypothetical protein [Roseicyclus sp.]MBO6623293.1 hypothetical protein [Roseicyclus sp.]MBO6922140.1 hypothetical protein [Roseicyclus sp.]
MIVRVLLLVATLLTGCAQHIREAERVRITYDPGGLLSSHYDQAGRYLVAGLAVEVEGYCASACLIYAVADNACLHRDARFGFHAGSNAIGTGYMARIMPPNLRAWYLSGPSSRTAITTLGTADLLALDPGAWRLCDG